MAVEKSMTHAAFLNELQETVSKLFYEKDKRNYIETRYPKRLKEYARSLGELKNAKTYEVALEAAQYAAKCLKPSDRLFGYTESAGWRIPNPGRSLETPYFRPPSLQQYDRPLRKSKSRTQPLKPYPTIENPLEPTYYKHLKWAEQDSSGAIVNGLAAIGIDFPDNLRSRVRLPKYQKAEYEAGLNPDTFILDQDKRILGWWKAERQLDWPEQMERYFEKRNHQDHEAIAKANWALLKPSDDEYGAERRFLAFC